VRRIFNSLFRGLFAERDERQVRETELILHSEERGAELEMVLSDGHEPLVWGSLSSKPNADFTIDFYANTHLAPRS